MPRKLSFTRVKQSGRNKKIYYLKKQILKEQSSLPPSWVFTESSNHLKLCKITEEGEVSYCIKIHEDLTFCISLFCHPISLDVQDDTIPDIDSVFTILHLAENTSICPGNPDENFLELATERNGKFFNNEGAYNFILVLSLKL